MSNMSYCRFQNTLQDLRDCYENIEEEVSQDEHQARLKMLSLCFDILAEADPDMLEEAGVDLEHLG